MPAKKTAKKVAKTAKRPTNSKPELVHEERTCCDGAMQEIPVTEQTEWSRGFQRGYEESLARDPLLRAKRDLDMAKRELADAKKVELERQAAKQTAEIDLEIAVAITRRYKLKMQLVEAELGKFFQ